MLLITNPINKKHQNYNNMKTIQITSSGSCELTENFMVTDEVYERFESEFSSIEDLEWDEEQEALVQLYDELVEYAQKIEQIKCIQLDTPECINEIDWFG
jgi:hypothetical protein